MELVCQATGHHSQQPQSVAVDRRQLSRDVQQLRVELSQKNLKIDSIEAAAQRKIAELEQKLAETLHQRQQLQVCVCVCVCESSVTTFTGDNRDRQLCLVISTYIHIKAQTPHGRFIVDALYKQVCTLPSINRPGCSC